MAHLELLQGACGGGGADWPPTLLVQLACLQTNGCGSKLNRRGYAGVGPCVHLPGFQFGILIFELLGF